MKSFPPFHLQMKQARIKHGWSQADVAQKVGCDTKTIQRWESAATTPQPYYRQKLADLFGSSLEELGLVEQFEAEREEAPVPSEYREHLDDAPDTTSFCGRTQELIELERWITVDKCRLITVLGMGGMGKTMLIARIVEQVRLHFSSIFWQTLQNAPPLSSVLSQCLRFLAPAQFAELPANREEQITLLLSILQKQRCLLILDNVETILQAEQRAGLYLPGYEDYAQLLQRIGNTRHQGCLLLTSREKPAGLLHLEDPFAAVRSLFLTGMPTSDGQQLLKKKALEGDEEQWHELIQRYGGNPLALKLVSESIHEFFAGRISEFLQQRDFILGDINDLLRQQFQRFSPQEHELVAWLAIAREAASLSTLHACILPSPTGAFTLDALESLHHRSLIEKTETHDAHKQPLFFLQPVILAYATRNVVQSTVHELLTAAPAGQVCSRLPETWQRFAFLQARATDYIRDIQQRTLLAPICASLLENYGQSNLEQLLLQLLALSRQAHLPESYLAGNVINMLVYLSSANPQSAAPELRGFDFSALFIRQAYLQDTHLPETSFRHSTFRDTVFANTFGAVPSVAFSPDGSLLAVGTTTGEIWLYNVVSGVLTTTLRGHKDGVWALAFSPDKRTLASGSDDQTVRLWNLASGQCSLILTNHTNRVRAVAFSFDGALLASGSNDQSICIWEVSSGRLRIILSGHTGAIWSLAFHPSSYLLASGGTDQTIRFWSIDTPSESNVCTNVVTEHTDRVRAVAFQHDGRLLASASDDHTVHLWDTQEQRRLMILRGHTNRVWSVAFHPDGQTVASSGEDGTIRFWSCRTGECLRMVQAHQRGVRSIAFSHDGTLLASGGEDQALRLWESQTGNCLKTVQGYTNRILSIDFTSSGQLVSSGDNQELHFWDVASGQCLKRISTRGQGTRAIAASRRSNILASVGGDQQVHLWTLATGQQLDALPYHTNWGRIVTFSPDAQFLASGGEDNVVLLWRLPERHNIQSLTANQSWLRALAFNGDSTLLASGGDDLIINLWDVTSGKSLQQLAGHTHSIRSLVFHPTQHVLFSASEDRTIRCWNTETGQCLYSLEGHTDRVLWIDMHPDGRHLASCSDDLSLRIWDLTNTTCQVIPYAHARRIRALKYAPDGRLLASCSDDGTIKLWETTSYTYLQSLIGERPYERADITGATGLTEAQHTTLHILGALEE